MALCQKVPNKTSSFASHRGPESLSSVNKESCIISLNANYLVISKPADVRMDGDFDVTVEKLLLYWKLQGINSTANMKWVHQLDYATSGCLCIALNRKAASVAALAFEQRRVKKKYLALVDGHVDLNKWPVTSPVNTNDTTSSKVKTIKKITSKHVPRTTGGKQWQDCAREESFSIFYDAMVMELQKAQPENAIDKIPVDPSRDSSLETLRDLAKRPRDEYLADAKLRKVLRKTLRARGVDVYVKDSSAGAWKECANSGIHDVDEAPEPALTVGTICSAPQTPHSILHHVADGESYVHVNIPVAEIPGDFRCEAGHASNPGKVAHTDIRVLARGYYNGRPVTKLLLSPLTGRRHQLRVHCLSIGHPIVGDFTYGDCCEGIERMMLHAYSLHIPGDCAESPIVNAHTLDPFPLEESTGTFSMCT